MNDRPTPETDAMETVWNDLGVMVVHSGFARRLERQRDELMEVCQRFVKLDLSGTDDPIVRFIVSAYQNNAKAAIDAVKGGNS
jgi:hypothetical protein